MQARHVLDRAPVAAVHRLRRVNQHGRRDRLARFFRHDQQDIVRHGRADAQEKIQVQVGRRVMRAVGVVVAALEETPVGRACGSAPDLPEGDAGLLHLAPLGADVLALLALQRVEKLFEIAVTVVQPVELHARAQQEAGRLQGLGLGLRRVQHMGRRQAAVFLDRFQCVDQGLARSCIACQQPAAGHWREGYCRQQLRIVFEAVAPVSVGPGPVEHILAVGVRFRIERHCRHQHVLLPERQKLRLPAGIDRCRAGGMERIEKRVRQEWIRIILHPDQRIPGGGLDFGQTG